MLFAWMCAWEIGGRNIVNDFADVAEDSRLGIKTVPLVYGAKAAARLTFSCLLITALLPLGLTALSQLNYVYAAGTAAAGLYLLDLAGLAATRLAPAGDGDGALQPRESSIHPPF